MFTSTFVCFDNSSPLNPAYFFEVRTIRGCSVSKKKFFEIFTELRSRYPNYLLIGGKLSNRDVMTMFLAWQSSSEGSSQYPVVGESFLDFADTHGFIIEQGDLSSTRYQMS